MSFFMQQRYATVSLCAVGYKYYSCAAPVVASLLFPGLDGASLFLSNLIEVPYGRLLNYSEDLVDPGCVDTSSGILTTDSDNFCLSEIDGKVAKNIAGCLRL